MVARAESIIITGSTSGMGFDMARRFLERGANVVLNGRDPKKLEDAVGRLGHADRVAAVEGNVSNPNVGKRLVAEAVERFGGVDVLINNAGIFAVKPFLECDEEDLDRFYSTNLKGTYLTSQAAVPALIERGGGAIINVGTVLVNHCMSDMPVSAPISSKGGVHALTIALASELAPHGIRVNAIAPGIIRTPLIGDNADALASIHPLQRIGEVEDTSDAALFLASAEFVTGTILEVDGGYTHGR